MSSQRHICRIIHGPLNPNYFPSLPHYWPCATGVIYDRCYYQVFFRHSKGLVFVPQGCRFPANLVRPLVRCEEACMRGWWADITLYPIKVITEKSSE